MPPNLPKRIVSGILGILSLLAGYCVSGVMIEGLQDFSRFHAYSWFNIIWELVMGLMAIASFALSLSFIRFARTGTEYSSRGSLKPLLLGAGLFIPGFVFSFAFTSILLDHIAPGGKWDDIGMGVSFFIGIATAIVGSVVLIKRQRLRNNTT